MTSEQQKPIGKTKRWVAFLILLSLLVAGFAFFSLSSKQAAPKINFTNIQGKNISQQSLHGKVYLVNFWATSCTTCIKEMPQMIASYEKFRAQGLEFLAIAMSYDPPNYVLNFAETRQLPFHVVLDLEGKIAQAFGDVRLTPTTFVVDKQGNILKRYVGEPSFDELNQLLARELAKS
ncbi:TlpA family protein disulfide reductase [Undibacterium fentianense]|uniref:TlpA family protein disulfide reductase n=1 Tax=Undibacterium fentianense TaxID=2828728 RepID=A0A941E1M7_9BURK|nr:TlpA disulfide reductase family protein [Undibacterium fentianense]MBR7799731.1 TlpA family protein disulfide reductase [Undibacterium fentianense]